MNEAIILLGPPASGKDTITRALNDLHPRYELFRKLKAGGGRYDGYRTASEEEMRQLSGSSRLLNTIVRYGNRYAVDQDELCRMLAEGLIPVIHVGRLRDLNELQLRLLQIAETLPVLLWASRSVVEHRLRHRHDAQFSARMNAWGALRRELVRSPLIVRRLLAINTAFCEPEEAAERIDHARNFGGEYGSAGKILSDLEEVS